MTFETPLEQMCNCGTPFDVPGGCGSCGTCRICKPPVRIKGSHYHKHYDQFHDTPYVRDEYIQQLKPKKLTLVEIQPKLSPAKVDLDQLSLF